MELLPGCKVLVYGAGNVSFSFVPALVQAYGLERVEVYSRSEQSARRLGEFYGVAWHSGDWDPDASYTLCVVAVSDRGVRESVARLGAAGRLVVHTSGSVPLVRVAHGMSGVVYPLQSFVLGEVSDLRDVPLYVEGQDAESFCSVRALALRMSKRVCMLDSSQRERLHVGGVVVNNFIYRLLSLVSEFSREVHLDTRDYNALLLTTIRRGLDAAGGAQQTGPARRGDLETIAGHLALLSSDFPQLLGPYVAMTESILLGDTAWCQVDKE